MSKTPEELEAVMCAWAGRCLGIPASTLAALRAGTMVAVPREPTPDFWPSYCAANNAMSGSAWDTLSQRLYRALVAHVASTEAGNG